MDEQKQSLAKIQDVWASAEEHIKHAEMISGSLAVPSINELRYAGRRIVDGFNETDENRKKELFNDAIESCAKAKWDAIDATISFIHLSVAEFSKKTLSEKKQNELTKLKSLLLETTKKISEGRTEERPQDISNIKKNDIEEIFAELIKVYDALRFDSQISYERKYENKIELQIANTKIRIATSYILLGALISLIAAMIAGFIS